MSFNILATIHWTDEMQLFMTSGIGIIFIIAMVLVLMRMIYPFAIMVLVLIIFSGGFGGLRACSDYSPTPKWGEDYNSQWDDPLDYDEDSGWFSKILNIFRSDD